jgi:hypothetical protein
MFSCVLLLLDRYLRAPELWMVVSTSVRSPGFCYTEPARLLPNWWATFTSKLLTKRLNRIAKWEGGRAAGECSHQAVADGRVDSRQSERDHTCSCCLLGLGLLRLHQWSVSETTSTFRFPYRWPIGPHRQSGWLASFWWNWNTQTQQETERAYSWSWSSVHSLVRSPCGKKGSGSCVVTWVSEKSLLFTGSHWSSSNEFGNK